MDGQVIAGGSRIVTEKRLLCVRRGFRARPEFYGLVLWALHRVLKVPDWTTVWVNLSCGVGTDQSELSDRHRELVRRFEARVAPLEYVGVRTCEGNGVIHAIWVIPARNGSRVELPRYAELSKWWSEVQPGAINSLFRVVGGRGDDAIRLARYIAGQDGYVRSFQSVGFRQLVELAEVVAG